MWHSMDGKTKGGLIALSSAAVVVAGYVGYGQLTSAQAGSARMVEFQVHVAGAVRSPQVVWVDSETLVIEAIKKAGGETGQADLDQLNLAAKMIPNTQLYVPRLGENAVERLGPYAAGYTLSLSGGHSPVSSGFLGGLIDINTADAGTLDRLPGVGPVISQAIIDYRNANGPFRSVEDLMKVKGIGPKKMEQIRPMVTVR